MLEFLQWMAATPESIALRESLYAWPFVESAHVLTLALFAGTAIMLDLRLLGLALRPVPVASLTGKMLPWTRAGFAAMVLTGLLLFYANPVRYYQNVFFRIKVVLLALVAINIWLFHARIHRRVAEWDRDPVTPRPARIAAVVSLAAWAGIIVAGRMIAYNWFDCDISRTRTSSWHHRVRDGTHGPLGTLRLALYPCPVVEATPIGDAIRTSIWLFPVIEAIHLLGLSDARRRAAGLDLRLVRRRAGRPKPIATGAVDAALARRGILMRWLPPASRSASRRPLKCYYDPGVSRSRCRPSPPPWPSPSAFRHPIRPPGQSPAR